MPQGQALGNNSNVIRYGEPNAANPNGYFRYYNRYGQPLDPTTGKSGPNDLTHIDPSYQGKKFQFELRARTTVTELPGITGTVLDCTP
jgi:hypothetical protein